jgi:trans-2,3-dihydro-3-hydroxyanthranilate isomerase
MQKITSRSERKGTSARVRQTGESLLKIALLLGFISSHYPEQAMRILPFIQTSVFVDNRYRFGGNQLATFWRASANSALDSEEMLGIAREMNFSETTFLVEPSLPEYSARVRIFTPGREIPFAGHPTLGTAFSMMHIGLVDRSSREATLELGVGPIRVTFENDGTISMVQPRARFSEAVEDTECVVDAIGLSVEDLHDEAPVQVVSTGLPFLIVPLRSLKTLQDAKPNAARIGDSLKHLPTQEILAFCADAVHPDSSLHARMFAPGVGVLEDPATGSAAGPLGAYVEHHSMLDNHTIGDSIRIEQGFEINRPSQLIYRYSDDGPVVSGLVRLTAEGQFYT